MSPKKVIEFTLDENEDFEKVSEMMQIAAGEDTFKELGPISDEEYNYYMSKK